MIRRPKWLLSDPVRLGRLDARKDDARASQLKVDPASGLTLVRMPWGRVLRRVLDVPIHGTLAGGTPLSGTGDASYTFTEAFDSGGSWGAGTATGTAYEVNGVLGLAGTVQLLRPDRSGSYRFQSVRVGTGGIIVPTAPYAGCDCPAIPITLTMTSADTACNHGMFQNCTILYQPTPAWAAPLHLAANIWLSTASFPDPIAGGVAFYYYLICNNNTFGLTRLYPTSPYGSPYRDGILVQWALGATGNRCGTAGVGFTLDNGQMFPGSDLSCSVKIDGP